MAAVDDPQQAAKLAALNREEQLMRVRCLLPAGFKCHRGWPSSCTDTRCRLEQGTASFSSSSAASCRFSLVVSFFPLQDDLELLRQFAEDDAVTYRGERVAAQ